ncbi:flavin-containing monooxygenase [Salinisphaera orenii]|uniref:flavin-containing monooxygenase n=1 Tax=Salinisphaera orenii TaxID=856731 RepID=UPI000F4C3130|nr:NAD(P)/FAD-dependent oxidoreductase [Salinisphaera orenii]
MTEHPENTENASSESRINVDALVVGAGFSGLYMLHLLRDRLNLKVGLIEAAPSVGGTWYWNCYPGARCDIPSYHYSYSFSEELQQEWSWSEKYAAQPEILEYLNYVAKKFDLAKNITFNCRVLSAHFIEGPNRWHIKTDDGKQYEAKYFIPAVGTLSDANVPEIPGQQAFEGECYVTGRWPQEGVNFTNKRVAVIGTGATAVQVIPLIAKEADHLTVFQRTPAWAAPLQNKPLTEKDNEEIKENYSALRNQAWNSFGGVPFPNARASALAESQAQRAEHYESCWQEGGFSLWLGSYQDILFDEKANETAAEFVRAKIRERVEDPSIAEKLCPPEDVYYGAKRQPCETGYYEAFNRSNVTLVDVKQTPIQEITPTGLRTTRETYNFDVLIYATGFDAFTGALFRMDIRGRDGQRLKDQWAAGPRTLYGLATHGFPNMFTITGPQSPSVLFNMPLGIEMHCDWIADCIDYMEKNDVGSIEPDKAKEDEWIAHVKEVADTTLLPKASSWYSGANIPGKPQIFMVYLGGGPRYQEIIENSARNGYKGFLLE